MVWQDRAWRWMFDLPKDHAFTADDLVTLVGHPDDGHKPNGQNNAVGSLFRKAKAARLIEPVGYTRSKTPTRKGGMIRVWRRA